MAVNFLLIIWCLMNREEWTAADGSHRRRRDTARRREDLRTTAANSWRRTTATRHCSRCSSPPAETLTHTFIFICCTVCMCVNEWKTLRNQGVWRLMYVFWKCLLLMSQADVAVSEASHQVDRPEWRWRWSVEERESVRHTHSAQTPPEESPERSTTATTHTYLNQHQYYFIET